MLNDVRLDMGGKVYTVLKSSISYTRNTFGNVDTS